MTVRVKQVTVRPVGVDGSAVATKYVETGPAIITHLGVDYQNQPSTTDILIKADTTSGATLGTITSANTDIVGKPVGMPGIDEGNAVLAATDASVGGWAVEKGIFIDVAQGDGQTSGDEKIVFRFWILN